MIFEGLFEDFLNVFLKDHSWNFFNILNDNPFEDILDLFGIFATFGE